MQLSYVWNIDGSSVIMGPNFHLMLCFDSEVKQLSGCDVLFSSTGNVDHVSSVSIVNRLLFRGTGFDSWQGLGFFSRHQIWDPPSLLSNVYRELFS
jgi:hypothetical protein